MENKFVYLLLTVVLLGSIVVFRAGLVPRNFDSLEDAFELYNKCEVSLAVEGEKSVMALGVKDGVTIRDFFYKKNDGYSSSFGFDSDTVFMMLLTDFRVLYFMLKKLMNIISEYIVLLEICLRFRIRAVQYFIHCNRFLQIIQK